MPILCECVQPARHRSPMLLFSRNSGTAPALWQFWDSVQINETVSMGWVRFCNIFDLLSSCHWTNAHNATRSLPPLCVPSVVGG